MSLTDLTKDLHPWDGGPNRMLPAGVTTNHLDFLEALIDEGLPELAGEDIADALKKGAITRIAAGETHRDPDSDRAMVVLWLPFFEDQRMYVMANEHVEHKEISLIDRWGATEAAIGALSAGLPSRPVELGFIVNEQVTVLPWFEYCYYYDLPPQYALACWGASRT
jgi:hypothetical protein